MSGRVIPMDSRASQPAPRASKADALEPIVVGVSFRSASVAVRERVAVAHEERAELLRILRETNACHEAMLVSTCNRVEVYGVGADAYRAIEHVAAVFASRVPGEDLRPHFYERKGRDAIHHMFRVASSLDSLVVGEPQILGQLKEAYEAAVNEESVNGTLGRIMHRAFHVAKRVRSETALGAGQVSVASVAVDLAKKIYSDLSGREVLLLGAGEIAESAARSLKAAGANRLLIANRSFDRAENLAKQIENMKLFGVPVVVTLNRFAFDRDSEVEIVRREAQSAGAEDAVPINVHALGGDGGQEAAEVVKAAADKGGDFRFLYSLDASIKEKIETIATKIYGADGVDYLPEAEAKIKQFTEQGLDKLPLCMAKTHLSLSHDPALKGRPRGFRVPIRDIRPATGAGYLYPLLGEMRTMPGLAKRPAAVDVDIDVETGRIIGLF